MKSLEESFESFLGVYVEYFLEDYELPYEIFEYF